MTLSLIVALADNGAIGRNGQIPWRLSADLKRFKQLTMGHHLIMGRKTFESLGRVLPGRTSIVLTRQADFAPPPGVLTAHSLDEAFALAAGDDEVFVIGGAEIYRLALPRCDRLYVTRVRADVEGDTHLPSWPAADWKLIEQLPHSADDKNQYDYCFETYQRAKSE